MSGQRIDFESHHPLAAYSTITACITFLLEPSEFCFEVQVLGDLVVWRAGEDHGGADGLADILVYNWKTGVNVWVSMHALLAENTSAEQIASYIINAPLRVQHSHAFDYAGRVRVELLSPSRLVVIDSNDFTMRLYQFDSERSTDCPLSWDSYDCLCVLKLPKWHKRAPSFLFVGMAESFLAHFPDLHAPETQQATFLPDPALATLVLRINFTYAEFEYRSWFPETVWKEERDERYLVFIPLTTLMRFPERSKLAQEKPPTIPWDDWGPLGTRVIRVEPHWYQPLSVVGAYTAELSRCIFDGRNATRDCILSVYEVHPFAAFVPPSHGQYKNAETGEREAGTVTASSGGPFERLFTPDEDWIHDSTAWKAPIHTTYPIRKTTRVIPSMTEDGKYLRGMRMMHGKLILFR